MTAQDQSAEREALPPLPEGYSVMMTPDPDGTPAIWYDERDMREYARAALSARETPAREGWQPIETAPRVGDDLTVWTWNGKDVGWMSSTDGFDEGDWSGITHWMWKTPPSPPVAPTTEGSEK